MSFDVLSEESTRDVTPSSISLYLEKRGWHVRGTTDSDAVIWIAPDENRRVLVPSSQASGDYDYVLRRVLQKLEEIELRPQQAILNDMLGVGADMLRVVLYIKGALSLSDLFLLTACLRDIAASIDPHLPEQITFSPPEFDQIAATQWTLTLTAHPNESGLETLSAALTALAAALARRDPGAILADARFADRRLITALHLILSRVAALKQIAFVYLPSQPAEIKPPSSVVFEAATLESLLQAVGFSSTILAPA